MDAPQPAALPNQPLALSPGEFDSLLNAFYTEPTIAGQAPWETRLCRLEQRFDELERRLGEVAPAPTPLPPPLPQFPNEQAPQRKQNKRKDSEDKCKYAGNNYAAKVAQEVPCSDDFPSQNVCSAHWDSYLKTPFARERHAYQKKEKACKYAASFKTEKSCTGSFSSQNVCDQHYETFRKYSNQAGDIAYLRTVDEGMDLSALLPGAVVYSFSGNGTIFGNITLTFFLRW